MTNRLSLYNLSLGTYVGTQTLANLTEDVASRYALDRVYDDTIKYMLELGIWKFALRTAVLTPDVSTPAFHRQYSYTIPTDFVRLNIISGDDRLGVDFEDYREQAGKWYADITPLYVAYVSNDAAFGLNLAKWPASFTDAVASRLAYNTVLPINKDRGDRADLLRLHEKTLAVAKRLDAVDEAVKGKPPGRWRQSRGYQSRYLGTSR